jgi:hypothetical protein
MLYIFIQTTSHIISHIYRGRVYSTYSTHKTQRTYFIPAKRERPTSSNRILTEPKWDGRYDAWIHYFFNSTTVKMDLNNNIQQQPPSDNEDSSESEVEADSSSDESGDDSADSGWGDEDAEAEFQALDQQLLQQFPQFPHLEEPAPLQPIVVNGNALGANVPNVVAQFVLMNDTDSENYTDGSSSHTAHTSSEMDTDSD